MSIRTPISRSVPNDPKANSYVVISYIYQVENHHNNKTTPLEATWLAVWAYVLVQPRPPPALEQLRFSFSEGFKRRQRAVSLLIQRPLWEMSSTSQHLWASILLWLSLVVEQRAAVTSTDSKRMRIDHCQGDGLMLNGHKSQQSEDPSSYKTPHLRLSRSGFISL